MLCSSNCILEQCMAHEAPQSHDSVIEQGTTNVLVVVGRQRHRPVRRSVI
jgi:hypothetical protein